MSQCGHPQRPETPVGVRLGVAWPLRDQPVRMLYVRSQMCDASGPEAPAQVCEEQPGTMGGPMAPDKWHPGE